MNDAYAVTRQRIASLLYTLNSSNPLYPNSFLDAFDNGTNTPSYGGINRLAAGNSAFKGLYINAGAGTTWNTTYSTATVGFKRAAMAAILNYITDQAGGETPTYVAMAPGDYAVLNGDFVGTETAFVTPGRAYSADTPIRSSFPNLNVSGVPIFQDHFVPDTNFFAPNMKYTNMYISEDAAMDFSGFYSLVPLNQIGQQGVMVLGYNLISSKSSSGAWVYGFGGSIW
jgi:hypothetical protein